MVVEVKMQCSTAALIGGGCRVLKCKRARKGGRRGANKDYGADQEKSAPQRIVTSKFGSHSNEQYRYEQFSTNSEKSECPCLRRVVAFFWSFFGGLVIYPIKTWLQPRNEESAAVTLPKG